jgi:hypothetical protein
MGRSTQCCRRLPLRLVFDVPVLVVVAFMVAFIAVELVGNPLRAARGRVRRALAEPVWHVDVLASIQPGAGRALGQAQAAMEDAQPATPLADADSRARVRLYRAAGFAQAALTMRSGGHAAVLVRPGAPYGADVESIGWPNRKGLPPVDRPCRPPMWLRGQTLLSCVVGAGRRLDSWEWSSRLDSWDRTVEFRGDSRRPPHPCVRVGCCQ